MPPLSALAGLDTIAALSTAQGMGAIAVIRVTGPDTIQIVSRIFKAASKKPLLAVHTHKAVFGYIISGEEIIDEVLLTVLLGPRSFTGEDTVEISCHGSIYIQEKILQLLIANGARTARPGEFSMRAFRNGKMDLSQTEAIADLIASQSKAAHNLAMQQMRGGFSKQINSLREQLINFASLIELELDFSEEDVEFADRTSLVKLVTNIQSTVNKLINSFASGNAIKNGIPVVIAGEPNAGKSTLLNKLLNEEKAIVSEIAGTTRDVIEDTCVIEGVMFRFIDTAGLRETKDTIETIGISKAYEKMSLASVIIYLFDSSVKKEEDVHAEIKKLQEQFISSHIIPVANKSDLINSGFGKEFIPISAKNETGIEELKQALLKSSGIDQNANEIIVTNVRHYNALTKVAESLDSVQAAISNNIPGDLLAIDIRHALHYLGEITGEITTEDLLGNIFSKFCIGK
jgi:tRNA modification GTPase